MNWNGGIKSEHVMMTWVWNDSIKDINTWAQELSYLGNGCSPVQSVVFFTVSDLFGNWGCVSKSETFGNGWSGTSNDGWDEISVSCEHAVKQQGRLWDAERRWARWRKSGDSLGRMGLSFCRRWMPHCLLLLGSDVGQRNERNQC